MFKLFRRRKPAPAAPAPPKAPPPVISVGEDGIPVVESGDVQRTVRIPQGQSRARKWPVLDYTGVPDIDMATWDFRVFGDVETPLRFTWDEMQALPRVRVHADMHCVTSWSLLDQIWEGFSVADLLARAGLKPDARFLIAHGADAVGRNENYTTNMPVEFVLSPEALLAVAVNGAPLPPKHGGPMRLVVPRLYAWKSAKWVRALEATVDDRAGFWERNGYHDRGDPWMEERYS